MDPAQICPLCGYTAATLPDLNLHRNSHCKVPGCPSLFPSKRHLNRHLVETHGYVKCAETRCGRVFKQRSQMERHYTVHGLVGTPAPAPPKETGQGLSWSATETLARETAEYLNTVVGLVSEERNTGAELRKLAARVLEGLAAEHSRIPLSLYIHAVEVAMVFPAPSPPSPPLPKITEGNDTPIISSTLPECTVETPSRDNLIDNASNLREVAEEVTSIPTPPPERRRVRKRTHSPNPSPLQPTTTPQPYPDPNADLSPFPCIEDHCFQRFRTPKELREHLEQEHYGLKKPCS